jgi:hypothetical protein
MACCALTRRQKAAVVLANAIAGRPAVPPTAAGRLYHSAAYSSVFVLCAIGALVLAVWEPSAGTPTASPADLLALAPVRLADGAFLLLLAFDLALAGIAARAVRPGGTWAWLQRGWVRTKLFALLALVANLLATVLLPSIPYPARLLRPLVLIERVQAMRQIAGSAARAAQRIANVVLLLLLHLLLSSVAAEVLFSGVSLDSCTLVRVGPAYLRCSTFNSAGCSDYFNSLEESLVHLFALLTGANFPAIMLPAYRCSAWSAWFFVAFIVTGCYLLMLALAVTNEGMAQLTTGRVLKRYTRLFQGCDAAFLQLTSPGDADAIDGCAAVGLTDGEQPATSQLGAQLLLPRDEFVAFWALVRPGVNEQVAGKLFAVIDADGRGALDYREFRRLVVCFSRVNASRSSPRERIGLPSSRETAVTASWGGTGDIMMSPLAASLGGGLDVVSTNPFVGARTQQPPAETASSGGSADGTWTGDAAAAASSRATRVNAMREGAATPLGSSGQLTAEGAEAQPWGSPPPSVVKARAAQFGVVQASDGKLKQDASAAWAAMKRILPGGGLPGPLPPGVSSASGRGRLIRLLHGASASLVFDVAIVINTVAVLWQLSLTAGVANSASTSDTLRSVQWAMAAVAAMEVSFKAGAWGPRVFFLELSYLNALDALLVTASVIAFALEGERVTAFALGGALSFARALRVLRLLSALVPGFGVTLAAAGDTLRAVLFHVAILLCAFYSFAVLGETLFSGALSLSNPAVASSSYGVAAGATNGAFAQINFDTLPGAAVALLMVAQRSEWPILMEGLVEGQNSLWGPRLFFVAVWAAMVLFLLNTIQAFMIDSFRVSKAEREAARAAAGTRPELVAAGGLEADHLPGIEDWRAVVDSSGVDLSGWRLSRPRQHADVYDALHRHLVVEAHADTFAPLWAGKAR